MKKIFETVIILFAMFGFWGMIYPDLCFTDEVCRIMVYDGTSASADEGDTSKKDIYTRICEAQPEEIVVKSKLLEALYTYKDKANVSEQESKGKSNVNSGYREKGGAKRGSGGGV